MKKGKIFFHPIDGSGPLTISWSSRPKGDAIEAKKGSGVGFFSEKGELLCVIFDEIQADNDHQILEFDHILVEIINKNGRITHTTALRKGQSKSNIRKRRSQKQTIN